MKRLILAAALCAPLPTAAQELTLKLSEQQVQGIKTAITQCDARVPLACARLLTYLEDQIEAARKAQAAGVVAGAVSALGEKPQPKE